MYEERRQESLKIMEETKHKRDKIQEVISYIEVWYRQPEMGCNNARILSEELGASQRVFSALAIP